MRKEKEEFVFQHHLTSENTCVLLTHSEPSLHQVTQEILRSSVCFMLHNVHRALVHVSDGNLLLFTLCSWLCVNREGGGVVAIQSQELQTM